MFKKTILSLSVCGLLAGAQSALAYEQGDFIVRGGAAVVDPNETSTDIRITAPALGTATNAKAGVNSDTQLGLTLSYMLKDNLSVELLAATPFQHDIYADGVLRGAGNIAETTHLPPTLTLNYYFNEPSAKFQPYIGAGLNYTIFFDEDVTSVLDNDATILALANLTAGGAGLTAADISSVTGTDIDLEDSTGFAFHAGFDYQLTDNIAINAAYWRIDIVTEAEITTTVDGGTLAGTDITAKVDVDIDPSVYMLGLSYKF